MYHSGRRQDSESHEGTEKHESHEGYVSGVGDRGGPSGAMVIEGKWD